MRIALIGYGYWGPNLARNIGALGHLYGICDNDRAKLESAKTIYEKKINYASDYREFLELHEVDAVAISTPTEYSYEIAMASLNAGKHVFIEKPISTTVERAENIKHAAEQTGLIVHCDHIMVYNPVIRYIKRMIDDGVLGDLMYVDVSRVNLGPIRKDVNAMLDLAVHDIAVIDYLSGGKTPTTVLAMGKVLYGKQESLTFLTMEYDSFVAHIKSSWVSPQKERKTIIAGTKKMVVFDDVQINKLAVYDHGIEAIRGDVYGTFEYETRTGDILYPHIPYEDSLRNSVAHFVDCVALNRLSLSGPDSSLRVMKVLEAAQQNLGG